MEKKMKRILLVLVLMFIFVNPTRAHHGAHYISLHDAFKQKDFGKVKFFLKEYENPGKQNQERVFFFLTH